MGFGSDVGLIGSKLGLLEGRRAYLKLKSFELW